MKDYEEAVKPETSQEHKVRSFLIPKSLRTEVCSLETGCLPRMDRPRVQSFATKPVWLKMAWNIHSVVARNPDFNLLMSFLKHICKCKTGKKGGRDGERNDEKE